MSARNGMITVEIEGTPRTFRFGMNCWHEFCQLQKVSVSELGQTLSSDNPGQLGAIRDLLYSAALSDCEIRGIPADFTRFTVGEWIDQMPTESFNAIMETMLQSKLLGNELGLMSKTLETVAVTQAPSKNGKMPAGSS